MPVCNAFLRQIGVNRGGTHANCHRNGMHIERRRCAHVQRRKCAQRCAHQMRMHSTCRQNHGDGCTFGRLIFICQEHVGASTTYAFFCLTPDTGNGFTQACFPILGGECAVNHAARRAREIAQPFILTRCQHRARQLEHVTLFG